MSISERPDNLQVDPIGQLVPAPATRGACIDLVYDSPNPDAADELRGDLHRLLRGHTVAVPCECSTPQGLHRWREHECRLRRVTVSVMPGTEIPTAFPGRPIEVEDGGPFVRLMLESARIDLDNMRWIAEYTVEEVA